MEDMAQPEIHLTPIKIKLSINKSENCEVCGDIAKRKVNGVNSCNGCASFFHRVRNGMTLTGNILMISAQVN